MKKQSVVHSWKQGVLLFLCLMAACMLLFAGLTAKNVSADTLIGTTGSKQIDLSGGNVFSTNSEEGWAPVLNLGDGLTGWADARYQSGAVQNPDAADLWICIDLQKTYDVDLLVFVGYQGASTNGLFRDFSIEFSLDGEKWWNVVEKTDYNNGGEETKPGEGATLGWAKVGNSDVWTHEFKVASYCRYIRVNITKVWASAELSNALSLREVAVFGQSLEDGQIGGVTYKASSSSEHSDWGTGYGLYALNDRRAHFVEAPRFAFVENMMPEYSSDPENVNFVLTADLNGTYLVDCFAFYSANWNSEGKPKEFTIEVSSDGGEWSEVAHITGTESGGIVTYLPAYQEGSAGYAQGGGAIDSPNSQQHCIRFPATLADKVRICITKTFVMGADNTTVFAETQVYGKPVFEPVAVVGLPDTEVSIALDKQTSYELNASVVPSAANQEILFNSSDTEVATVSEEGVVTFLKAGTVTVRASSKEVPAVYDEVTFVVTEGTVLPESVAFKEGETFEMKQGEKHTFEIVFTPGNTTNKEVSFSLLNVGDYEASDIISVEGNIVTAMRTGQAKLRVRSVANNELSADIIITVKPSLPESITFDKEEIEIRQGGFAKVNVTVLPSGATDKTFSVSVPAQDQNKLTATVGSGTIFLTAGDTIGETTLTVKCNADENVSATIKVKIIAWSEIDADGYQYLDLRGYLDGFDFYDTVHNSETSYNTWYLFENLEKGNNWLECSISLEHVDWSAGYGAASLIDGIYEISGSNEMNRVYAGVNEEVIGSDTPELAEPCVITLKLPALASVKKVGFVAQFGQNENFLGDFTISVSVDGQEFTTVYTQQNYAPTEGDESLLAEFAFDAVEAKFIRLTVTKLSPDKTADSYWLNLAEMLVTGKYLEEIPTEKAPESISGLEAKKDVDYNALGADKTIQLTASVLPAEAPQTILWTSSNEKVAKVDSNGKVTILANGTATITATSSVDKDVSASCVITVTGKTDGQNNPPEDTDKTGCGSTFGGTAFVTSAILLAASIFIFVNRRERNEKNK